MTPLTLHCSLIVVFCQRHARGSGIEMPVAVLPPSPAVFLLAY
jgi:hypothetical protein